MRHAAIGGACEQFSLVGEQRLGDLLFLELGLGIPVSGEGDVVVNG
jgi:hypothetical protein